MKIGILGAAGRMGQMLVREVSATSGAKLAGGADRADHPDIGKDIAALAGLEPCGLILGAESEAVIKASDVVIDFTHATIAPSTRRPSSSARPASMQMDSPRSTERPKKFPSSGHRTMPSV